MKKMLDKPYKKLFWYKLIANTMLYSAITILVMMLIVIFGFYTTPVNTPIQVVINNSYENQPMGNEEELLNLQKKKEKSISLADTPVKKEVSLSRGGSPIKQPSEREQINKYVREIASKYNMDAELIMSVIQTESTYNPKSKNGNCLGLMQVSTRWHAARAKRLGVTDFYDPYSNILLGVDYLSELRSEYKDMRLVLMLYNMSHKTAINMYKSGKISNYAKTIISRAEQYKKGE